MAGAFGSASCDLHEVCCERVTNPDARRDALEMRAVLLVALVAIVACGSAAPPPSPSTGSRLTVPQLDFAVIDAVGRPVYCDPDFYPIARQGGEEANAVSMYPQI